MRRLIQLLFLMIITLAFLSCGDNGPAERDPMISEIQPESGPPGTSVTISGSDFSPTTSENTVTFAGTTAEVQEAEESQLVAAVPEEAESGLVEVTVDGNTASGPQFTVESEAPGISSVEPDSGTVGIEVTIEGMNFSATASENTITFNETEAPVNSAAEDELITEVPEGAEDGPVEVTVDGETATGPEFDIYVESPEISSVEPDTAVTGAEIVIQGEHFAENPSDNTVMMGDVQATVLEASPEEITTEVPQNTTDGPIRVMVGEQSSEDAEFNIVTTLMACYGNDVALNASLQWVTPALTTPNDDVSREIDADSDGNIYMVLRDQGIVGKFDSSGDLLWEQDISGDIPNTSWKGIETDGGNVYIVGRRELSENNLGIAQLDYHFSNLSDGNARAGNADVVLTSLSANDGSVNWAQQIGSPDSDGLPDKTIDVLPSGDIIVAAQMAGPFMPENNEPDGPAWDAGIAKFQADGSLQTVEQISEYRNAYSLTTDDEGSIYLGAKDNDDNTVYAKYNSDLAEQASSEQVTNQINSPVPMPDGGAVVYGNTGTPVEDDKNVYINDAYAQRLDENGQEQWVHQQKFSNNGSTKFTSGTRLPGGGIGLSAQNASELGGRPYLAFYADDGKTLLIDESSYFDFNDGSGAGWPISIESFEDMDGNVQVVTMGTTTWDWANDGSRNSGGKDLWMTGMELQCEQQE